MFPPTRLRTRDLVREMLTAVASRPGRAALSVLGVFVGIGMLVAITGLTSTAAGQISDEFSALKATEVTLDDVGPANSSGGVYSFPTNASSRTMALHGVRGAGTTWPLPAPANVVQTSLDPRVEPVNVPAEAASAGYLVAIGATVSTGRLFDALDESRRLHVAIIGVGAARRLGVTDLSKRPTVYILGSPYNVIGIVNDVDRAPEALSAIFIPASTALRNYGVPRAAFPARLLIATDLGAAHQVAREAPLALRPDLPDLLRARPLPATSRLETNVTRSVGGLFVALSGVALFISLASITITMLIAVLQRTAEFGLRRSMGARPRHILSQVLAESGTLGLLGGLLATGAGNGAVIVISIVNEWTAIVDVRVTLAAPIAGLIAGLIAGAYPAWRAGRVEPVAALRH